MTARSGMANLILELRALTFAGTADYSVNGVSYFTDDQLQDRLDTTRQTWTGQALAPMPIATNQNYQWFDYIIDPYAGYWIEEGFTTDSGWCVRDATFGSVDHTLYTVNYKAGRITFLADQAAKDYLVDMRAYDLYAAAAFVWNEKASFESNSIAWQTDNHRIHSEQRYKHAMERYEFFANKGGISGQGGIGHSLIERVDEAGDVSQEWPNVEPDNKIWRRRTGDYNAY